MEIEHLQQALDRKCAKSTDKIYRLDKDINVLKKITLSIMNMEMKRQKDKFSLCVYLSLALIHSISISHSLTLPVSVSFFHSRHAPDKIIKSEKVNI